MKALYFVGFMLVLPGSAAMAADAYPSLPPGPGRDTMIQVCSQCHSPEMASAQRMDRAGWQELIGQMQDNGASASDADFKTIVNYLATAFPATPPAAATGGSSAQTNDSTGTVTPNIP